MFVRHRCRTVGHDDVVVDESPDDARHETDEDAEPEEADEVVVRVPYTALSRQFTLPDSILAAQRVVAQMSTQWPVIEAARRAMDSLPSGVELPAISAAAASARWITGSSVFAAAIEAQQARTRILATLADSTFQRQIGLLDTSAHTSLQRQLNDLTRIARVVENMPTLYRGLTTPLLVERSVSIGIRGWDEATRAIGAATLEQRVEPLEAFGRGTFGITAAGIALSEGTESGPAETEELLGPQALATRLRGRLGELDPALPARLDGAWGARQPYGTRRGIAGGALAHGNRRRRAPRRSSRCRRVGLVQRDEPLRRASQRQADPSAAGQVPPARPPGRSECRAPASARLERPRRRDPGTEARVRRQGLALGRIG
ncbi:MAG TPA: hypothetical protein VHA73_16450 [Acidimicrobiales bacterium]|nr:hypothetical protein [Acidimicrobiales bacterium]